MKINSVVRLPLLHRLVGEHRQREWGQDSLSNPRSLPQGAPKAADPFLSRSYALFKANLSNSEFGLEQRMGELGMSHTNLFRKVKALIGMTAHELLRNYRLKRAAKLLRSGGNVQQEAWQAGSEIPDYSLWADWRVSYCLWGHLFTPYF